MWTLPPFLQTFLAPPHPPTLPRPPVSPPPHLIAATRRPPRLITTDRKVADRKGVIPRLRAPTPTQGTTMPRPTAATLSATAATTRRPLLRPAALTHATTHVTLATPGTLAIESMGAVGVGVIAARGAAAATVTASPAAEVPPETPRKCREKCGKCGKRSPHFRLFSAGRSLHFCLFSPGGPRGGLWTLAWETSRSLENRARVPRPRPGAGGPGGRA